MTTQQAEALRLADGIEQFAYNLARQAAKELRRLHAESEQHLQELRSYRITVENREARIVELERRVQELEASQACVPLSAQQLQALGICISSNRVSVAEVQRKLGVGYSEAQALCQSLVDFGGITDGMELAPNLSAHGITQEKQG